MSSLWEQMIYAEGRHLNRYPFDAVVSFLFRHAPARPYRAVRVLEVGCGAGNNLWCAAREGFRVAGIDVSPSAIAYARSRFAQEGLCGEFQVGDLADPLPWPDAAFDLAIDRAALTCLDQSSAQAAIAQVWRVVVPGGLLFCNPYASDHTSHGAGQVGADGRTTAIDAGSLVGVGPIRFYDEAALRALFCAGWDLLALEHVAHGDRLAGTVHSEWRAIARKRAAGAGG